MRFSPALALVFLLASIACTDRKSPMPAQTSTRAPDRTAGEARATIAPRGEPPAVLRSGPEVPVSLPAGFTLYPGAEVVANTVVERAGRQRTLVVFETGDAIADVIPFYRRQIVASEGQITVDVGGDVRASLGGTMVGGGTFALSARRERRTRVELAFD